MRKIIHNKYEVLKSIAESENGTVYLVKDLHRNQLMAIKSSRKEESYYREQEVLGRLQHPALPKVIDFFEEKENKYMVMDYIEGITLEQYLRKFGRIEVKQAVRWAIELTEVLGYLHEQTPPIVYQDLKPANIMITPEKTVKLIDFGTAVSINFGQEKEKIWMGTPGYSAPEQLNGDGSCKESDIYALGVVLHEMVTGISPRSLYGVQRSIRDYDKTLSRKLAKIIANCTGNKPSERYHSMNRLKEVLLSQKEKTKKGRWKDKRKKKISIRQEKSIFLTESGRQLLGGIGIVILSLLFLGLYEEKEMGRIVAAESKREELCVEIRDEWNRKLLLKEDYVYKPKERLRIDIPSEKLPKGKLDVWVLAANESGTVYESRVFFVEGN